MAARVLNDYCFVFFSLEMWDPLRTKYTKIYKNQNVWRFFFLIVNGSTEEPYLDSNSKKRENLGGEISDKNAPLKKNRSNERRPSK